MLPCLPCLICFNIPFSFFEKIIRLTWSNLPIKKWKSYLNLLYLFQDTTYEAKKLLTIIDTLNEIWSMTIVKVVIFPKKNVSWKSNKYKSNIQKTWLVLHFVWFNGLLPFFRLSVPFDVASCVEEKTSLINPFNNFLGGFVADEQDFCSFNKPVFSTCRL